MLRNDYYRENGGIYIGKGIILIQILIGRNDTFIGNDSIGGLLELKNDTFIGKRRHIHRGNLWELHKKPFLLWFLGSGSSIEMPRKALFMLENGQKRHIRGQILKKGHKF